MRYEWRYHITIPLATSEAWHKPLKTALRIYTRIMNIQAAIQDVSDIIKSRSMGKESFILRKS